MKIDASLKIDELELVKHLNAINSPFINTINSVYEDIRDLLDNRIQHVFPNYTLHNSGHSFRIAQYMAKLVGDYTELSEIEIALLVLAALLHDVGMAVSAEDVSLIESDAFTFCHVKFSSMLKIEPNKNLALQEYVRRIHASLSARFIKNNLVEKLRVPNMTSLNFSNELSLICESHTQSFDWIKNNLRVNEIKGDYVFNPQFIACILRLADILDIDSNRTPYRLYNAIAPTGISNEEWKQHFIIYNNDKIAFDAKTGQKKIFFHGKSNNAKTHRKLLHYIEWVKTELTNSVYLANGMSKQYNLLYDTNIEVDIQTEGYTFSDYKMTLDFRAISSLLMGESIYGSKQLGLRELVQNSVDSCRIRNEVEQSLTEFDSDKYVPKVKVILDKEKNTVVIKDNGTGMTLDVLKNHFLNIGVSYYKSQEFLLDDFAYKPIGNFGIGFLACFMLSPSVKVVTRHYKSKSKYTIELEQGNEWISLSDREDVVFDGTEVYLSYNHFISVFSGDAAKVEGFLEQYFLTDKIEIEVIDRVKRSVEKINNKIDGIKQSTPSEIIIDISKYVNDASGYISIRRREGFVHGLEDINFIGDLYYYTNEYGLELLEDFNNVRISDFILNGQLSYYSIPLVPPRLEDDFELGLKFTESDVEEVVKRMDRDLIWISILVPSDLQEDMHDQDLDYRDYLLGQIGFDELVVLGHSTKCITRTFVNTIHLYEYEKDMNYVEFAVNPTAVNRFYMASKSEKLFLRGVLISDYIFIISFIASAFSIEAIKVNLNSRKFIPNISRNDINNKSTEEINYLIGKIAHLGAIDLLNLPPHKQQTLISFVQHYYNEVSPYEKKSR